MSLSSSWDAALEEVDIAESEYDAQSSLVDGLFENLHSSKRARKWGPGRFKGMLSPSSGGLFWGKCCSLQRSCVYCPLMVL